MSAPAAALADDVRDMALPNAEIDWERLDKTKFFLVGAGLFSGLSCVLYPLTVVKTRVQVQDRASATAYKSMADAYRQIFRHEGIRGFYKVRISCRTCLFYRHCGDLSLIVHSFELGSLPSQE